MGKRVVLCVLFSGFLLLVACSSKNHELIGKWYNPSRDLLYEFNTNGEGKLATRGKEYSFKYEISNEKITIITVDRTKVLAIETHGYEIINENALIIYDGGAKVVFYKTKMSTIQLPWLSDRVCI